MCRTWRYVHVLKWKPFSCSTFPRFIKANLKLLFKRLTYFYTVCKQIQNKFQPILESIHSIPIIYLLYFHISWSPVRMYLLLKHEPKNDQDLLAMVVSIPDAKGSIGRILLSSSSSASTSSKKMCFSLYKDIWVIKRSSWLEKATTNNIYSRGTPTPDPQTTLFFGWQKTEYWSNEHGSKEHCSKDHFFKRALFEVNVI